MKHLLKLFDLTPGEITEILDLADELKAELKNGISKPRLNGKTLGMIFQKSSTRTRVSFEVGMYQLGGMALYLNANDLQIGRGEPVEDTARVLSRYLDGIMIRTYAQEEVERLAEYSGIPVINGLTDLFHPCQVLADLMTMREYLGKDLTGKKLCFIGDGNNMANSLIVGGLKMGMKVSCACPENYHPAKVVLDFAAAYGDNFTLTDKPEEAAVGADVMVTDVWASMGQESEREQRMAPQSQGKDGIMAPCKPHCIVQHCLRSQGRGDKLRVFEAHAKEIFDEAENRLHAQEGSIGKAARIRYNNIGSLRHAARHKAAAAAIAMSLEPYVGLNVA